ncbi:MAG: hypothetical protein GYA17_21360 [Chloroflexi bacterium]|jgi:gas vesicle protein|nr:YtxH domain-containing protein [Anaerolineaceae bacterium]NMB90919.1 hypothetical protein [Chloroflexota bacterium]
MNRIGLFLAGAIAGAVAGAVAALLLAPASGDHFRGQIKDYTQKVVDEVRSASEQKRVELEKELDELRAPQA